VRECEHDRIAQFVGDRRGRPRRREQRELDIGQRGQARIRRNDVQAVHELRMRDRRHGKAGLRGRQQTGTARTDQCDPMIEARAGERSQCGLAIRTRLGEQRERHGRAGRQRCPLRAGPHERLAPQDASATRIRTASADHDVEFALVHRVKQFGRNADSRAERDARIAHRKGLHHVHQPDIGEIFGEPDTDRAFARSAKELRLCILIECEDRARIAQQQFAVRRERDGARRARKQIAADLLFKPAQMRADGRLREVEPRGGVREAAFLDDGHE
jgi:hypothetical protein